MKNSNDPIATLQHQITALSKENIDLKNAIKKLSTQIASQNRDVRRVKEITQGNKKNINSIMQSLSR